MHQRYRRQTDGRPIAYSERERKFTSAKNPLLHAVHCVLAFARVITGPPNGPVLFCALSSSSVVVCNARGQSDAAGPVRPWDRPTSMGPAAETARRDSTVTSRQGDTLFNVEKTCVAGPRYNGIRTFLGTAPSRNVTPSPPLQTTPSSPLLSVTVPAHGRCGGRRGASRGVTASSRPAPSSSMHGGSRCRGRGRGRILALHGGRDRAGPATDNSGGDRVVCHGGVGVTFRPFR